MNLFEMNMRMGEVSEGIFLGEDCDGDEKIDIKDKFKKFNKKGKDKEDDEEEEDEED